MSDTTFRVTGMSCDHCVKAVTEQVSAVPGVSGVTVDLASGVIRVSGAGFTTDDVRAAVDEAGYDLAP